MYQPMLFLHWKQVRFGLIPFILAAFALPLLNIQGLGTIPGEMAVGLDAYRIVSENQEWLMFYPLLAAGIGMTLALSAWNWDHQLKHVYALSLPLTRLEYTMLKMGAGAVLTLLPVAALWLGAHAASMAVALPDGLHAYPNQLAFRFMLAALVSYSLLFAMAAGTIKTTITIISSIVVLVLVAPVFEVFLVDTFLSLAETPLLVTLVEFALDFGPFEVFTGNWSLIDV